MYTENTTIRNKLSIWLIFMFCLITLMIVVGGLTRLTDSGLSITKWELFSGTFPPLNDEQWINYFEEYKLIPEFKIQNYSMTLNEFKIFAFDNCVIERLPEDIKLIKEEMVDY